jgi:hypothetical protein
VPDPDRDPSPRRSRGCPSGERGAATAEVVIATPLLLLLIAAVVQFALWYHAVHTAEAVARQSLATTRLVDVAQPAAQDQAEAVLDRLGGPTLDDPAVTVDRRADTTTVVVTGRATRVLPFVTIPVETTVTGPTERFRPAGADP